MPVSASANPFGFARLQVTRLIAALIGTGSSEVHKELTSLGTLSVLLVKRTPLPFSEFIKIYLYYPLFFRKWCLNFIIVISSMHKWRNLSSVYWDWSRSIYSSLLNKRRLLWDRNQRTEARQRRNSPLASCIHCSHIWVDFYPNSILTTIYLFFFRVVGDGNMPSPADPRSLGGQREPYVSLFPLVDGILIN